MFPMSLVSSAEKFLGTKTADPPILKSESLEKNPRNRTQKKSENVAEGLKKIEKKKKKKKKTPFFFCMIFFETKGDTSGVWGVFFFCSFPFFCY